ncbi:MAG: hypothetical protein ABFC80_08140, partial [Coriobacteriales bacterium]
TAMIIGGLQVLAVVVGLLAAFVIPVLFPSAPETEVRAPAPKPASSAQQATTTAEAAQPAPEVPLDEVFTFRDIFDPLIKPLEESATPTASPDSTSAPDVSEYAADTLYLLSISTVGGSPTALMMWDQKSYTLSEGDSIPGTPWKVLSIGDDSVVMLYGDQQVVLTVGQGIQK